VKLIVAAQARREIFRVAVFYDQVRYGLGDAFLSDIGSGFAQVRDFPLAWPVVVEPYRRYRLGRFPYGILYQARAADVLVLAVGHLKRGPRYWMSARQRQP
jgi:ParE toxin of type II toxin-antitoxin system, parDE